jgi:hypothetical protein
MKTEAEVLQRLDEIAEYVKNLPEEKPLSLDYWTLAQEDVDIGSTSLEVKEAYEKCGSIHCVLGWIAAENKFDLKMSGDNVPMFYKPPVIYNGFHTSLMGMDAGRHILFGDMSEFFKGNDHELTRLIFEEQTRIACGLFSAAGGSAFDIEVEDLQEEPEDSKGYLAEFKIIPMHSHKELFARRVAVARHHIRSFYEDFAEALKT